MQRSEQGFILPIALGLMVVTLSLAAAAATLSFVNQRNSADSLRVTQAQYAAEAGLENAQYLVWNKVWAGAIPASRQVYASKINLPTYESGNFSLARQGISTVYPTTGQYSLANNTKYSFTITRRLPTVVGDPRVVFDMVSTGILPDGTTRTLKQVFQVAGSPFAGLDYAILSNNINCIFCHTQVQDLKALGSRPNGANPQARVKVGSLEALDLEPGQADTMIAGTLHVRGDVRDLYTGNSIVDTTNNTLNNPGMFTTQNVNDAQITSSAKTDFKPKDCNTAANCQATSGKQNLYYNYPDANKVTTNYAGAWPDGQLPDRFPSPIPDDGAGNTALANNKIIDRDEWNSQVQISVSGLDVDNPSGTIRGGVISVNGKLDATTTLSASLTGGNFPSSSNLPPAATSTITSSNDDTPQNLILDGTTTPLNIQGTLYVNGDVVIKGKITGNGKIVARGNVYQMGDVVYDCTATQGQSACDYSRTGDGTLPTFGIVAGGNVLVGDFMSVRGKSFTDINKADMTTMESGSRETQGFALNGGGEVNGSAPSFAYREMSLFNRNEIYKAIQDVNYVPRLYTMTPDSPVVFTNNFSISSDNYFNNSYIEVFGNGTGSRDKVTQGTSNSNTPQGGQPDNQYKTFGASDTLTIKPDAKLAATVSYDRSQLFAIMSRAQKLSLTPKTSWLSLSDLKKTWIKSKECGGCPSGAVRTDGLLYSSNAVFAVARNSQSTWPYNNGTERSKTTGKWDLRGSLVAADLGALVTGNGATSTNGVTSNWNSPSTANDKSGLSVYYDARIKRLLALKDNSAAALVRNTWSVGVNAN